MKGLIIKKPWIDLILAGEKVWEIRGRNTKKRERIALIQSKSGLIVGEIDLVDSIALTKEKFKENHIYHRIPITESMKMPYEKIYAWVFQNAVRYESPIPYVHPQGAVVWVDLR